MDISRFVEPLSRPVSFWNSLQNRSTPFSGSHVSQSLLYSPAILSYVHIKEYDFFAIPAASKSKLSTLEYFILSAGRRFIIPAPAIKNRFWANLASYAGADNDFPRISDPPLFLFQHRVHPYCWEVACHQNISRGMYIKWQIAEGCLEHQAHPFVSTFEFSTVCLAVWNTGVMWRPHNNDVHANRCDCYRPRNFLRLPLVPDSRCREIVKTHGTCRFC